jgi:hypothetical protein
MAERYSVLFCLATHLSVIAAGRSRRAAILHGGTATDVFGATTLALLATGELRIGHAAGARRLATSKAQRTTVVGRFVGNQNADPKKAEDAEGSSQKPGKHEISPESEMGNTHRSKRANALVDAREIIAVTCGD